MHIFFSSKSIWWHLVELCAEVTIFLLEHNAWLETILNDETWVYNWHILPIFLAKWMKLIYPFDEHCHSFNANALVPFLKKKLVYWLKCVANKYIDCFFNRKPPSLNSVEYGVLIDLASHIELKPFFFSEIKSSRDWYHLTDEFKILSVEAKLVLLSFLNDISLLSGIVRLHSYLNKRQELLKCRTKYWLAIIGNRTRYLKTVQKIQQQFFVVNSYLLLFIILTI